MIFIGIALFLIAYILCFILFFLTMIQWVVYADSGSLSQGLNFLKSIRLIISHPIDALITIILLFVLYVILSMITLLLEIPVCTIIAIPFVTVAGTIAIYYVVVRFYQKAMDRYASPSSGPGTIPGHPEGSDSPHML